MDNKVFVGVDIGGTKCAITIGLPKDGDLDIKDKKSFPTIDVDATTALQYLRKETITLSESLPKGFVLITFRKQPIGFVKNLGNRTNNLYPMEWKIKSSYLPNDLPVVLK